MYPSDMAPEQIPLSCEAYSRSVNSPKLTFRCHIPIEVLHQYSFIIQLLDLFIT
jgi:hypothetical protein